MIIGMKIKIVKVIVSNGREIFRIKRLKTLLFFNYWDYEIMHDVDIHGVSTPCIAEFPTISDAEEYIKRLYGKEEEVVVKEMNI